MPSFVGCVVVVVVAVGASTSFSVGLGWDAQASTQPGSRMITMGTGEEEDEEDEEEDAEAAAAAEEEEAKVRPLSPASDRNPLAGLHSIICGQQAPCRGRMRELIRSFLGLAVWCKRRSRRPACQPYTRTPTHVQIGLWRYIPRREPGTGEF